jgi:hypothetical protein
MDALAPRLPRDDAPVLLEIDISVYISGVASYYLPQLRNPFLPTIEGRTRAASLNDDARG